jgi:photosystem II stability/assembly factor-like uncharacterized protein
MKTSKRILATFAMAALACSAGSLAADKAANDKPDPREALWGGLEFRSIGPAITSGRIVDLAVDPSNAAHWIVASAAGGVWATSNAGNTWTPVMDDQGSWSIGTVTFAPSDPMVVWVGSGENNIQRVVGYGDGVYKSIDGGKTFTNMGLGKSEHIGKILVDPRDANVVWVAAQGPLWAPGGDRGLYKTTDGGKTWNKVLAISENTGVTDIAMDPRNPDVVYAAAWQRRRHVWTMVSGGPESSIYKTTDGGKSFRKITKGLPKEELGRAALAISPQQPDVVYAMVEAANGKGGFFRSSDRGETWEKRSGTATSGNYYTELFTDPHRMDRIFSVDTFLQVSDDGGSSFHEVGEDNKHVDNHVVWVDPARDGHYLVGCDGGLYETFDAAKNWHFFANLPVTQFYHVAVDDSAPFYRVYGGAQDNFTLGGPSRTGSANGILNQDWQMVSTGDGFQPRVETGNPDIVYAMVQYGVLMRVDRKTNEATYIQPLTEPGEPTLKWNWDSPYIVSPFSPTRLYFGANKLFRSDDRGDNWRAISPDLTRQLDRNQLPVFGKVLPADTVGKNSGTSFYGAIVALSESRLKEGLLYAGTDDGLIQISEDGGANWRKVDGIHGVPRLAFVRKVEPSRHSLDVVYAAFDNAKNGDFTPYLYKSSDRGKSWASIAANLPARGTVYSFLEDPVDANLLFVGTEFGVYCSQDGGKSWFKLTGGLPSAVQVRDLTLQERENDLVLATFGRGFYVLDDMRPLRNGSARNLDAEATLFPVRPALAYVEEQRLGYRGKGFQGESFFAAANPPFGAVFTFNIKNDLQSLKAARQKREAALAKDNKPIPYPSLDEFRAEANEEPPAYFLVVRDDRGDVVRRIAAPTGKGLHRVAWDLLLPPADPAQLEPPAITNAYSYIPAGPMAAPGKYTVTMEKRVLGKTTPVAGPEPFEVDALAATLLTAPDRQALEQFLRDALALQRAAQGTSKLVGDSLDRIALDKKAIDDSAARDPTLADRARAIEARLRQLQVQLDGDAAIAKRNEPTAPSLVDRSSYIVGVQWTSTSAPTGSSRRQYQLASAELADLLKTLKPLVEVELPAFESGLNAVGAPWTPGRVPEWPLK